MVIRGIGGFGSYDYGIGMMIASSAIAPFSASASLGTMVAGAAACVGNWASDYARFESNPRAYIDRLCARLGVGSPSRPAEKKKLAQGTDSPNSAERGASYIREKLGNGNALPSQSSVLNSIYGPPPKDEEAKRKYDGDLEKARENDNILRTVAERIVGDWMDDPKARGEFMLKWGNARTPAEQARALLDPRGDGSYLQLLNIGRIGDPRDIKNWDKVADWFVNKLGDGVISSMGAETANVVSSRGYSPATPEKEVPEEAAPQTPDQNAAPQMSPEPLQPPSPSGEPAPLEAPPPSVPRIPHDPKINNEKEREKATGIVTPIMKNKLIEFGYLEPEITYLENKFALSRGCADYTNKERPTKADVEAYLQEFPRRDSFADWYAKESGFSEGAAAISELKPGMSLEQIVSTVDKAVEAAKAEEAIEAAKAKKKKDITDRVIADIKANHLDVDGKPVTGTYNLMIIDLGDGVTYNISYEIEDGGAISRLDIDPPIK